MFKILSLIVIPFAVPTITDASIEQLTKGAEVTLTFDDTSNLSSLSYQPINMTNGEIGDWIILEQSKDAFNCNGNNNTCGFITNNEITNNFYNINNTYNFNFVINNDITNNYYNITNNYITINNDLTINETTNITNTSTIDPTTLWVIVGLLSFIAFITIIFWTLRLSIKK